MERESLGSRKLTFRLSQPFLMVVLALGVSIDKIWWQCNGMKVQILWEATADQFCIELGENQSGYHDYRVFGGLTNNAGSGKTGDVAFTTVGHTGGDTYTVIIECTKTFA
jgi:hypothetical protein